MEPHDSARDQIAALVDKVDADAYARGCRDTLRRFQAFIAAGDEVLEMELNAAPYVPEARPLREGTAEAQVLANIEEYPGSRGVEIVQRLPHIQERTVRTALFRLRKASKITRAESLWWPQHRSKEIRADPGQEDRP